MDWELGEGKEEKQQEHLVTFLVLSWPFSAGPAPLPTPTSLFQHLLLLDLHLLLKKWLTPAALTDPSHSHA